MALQPNSYTPTQTANELWFCCCKELQNDLQNVGITVSPTEGDILDKVKDLAVKAVNSLLNLCEYFKMSQKEGKGQYVARVKGAADLCDFTVGSGTDTVFYVDQMVLGRLVAGLRDKQITREILDEAVTRGIKTSKLKLCHIEQLVQVKEQAKEEGAQLNMEGEMELNRVGKRASKPPGKVQGKSNSKPGGREHPYSRGGGGTGDKPFGCCSRQHGSQEQCPATG